MTDRDNDKRSGAAVDAPLGAFSHSDEGKPVLQFSAPTEIVELPSQGKFYPEGHPLYGLTSVEIRHMTAKEEDILTNVSLIKKGTAIDRMLQNILVSPKVEVSEFLAGDKNALTVAARITGFGPNYATKVRCPSCGETKDFEFDLNDHKTIDGTNLPDGVESTETGTFMFSKLPGFTGSVEIRLMTGQDEKSLAQAAEQKKKHSLPPTMITDQLKMVIVSVAGSNKPVDIGYFVDNMPLLTTKKLRSLYKEITPNIDLTQEYSCSNCDYEESMEVPFSTEFFWPKQ